MVVQADSAWRGALRKEPGSREFEMEWLEDAGGISESLSERPRELELVVLGSAVRDPIRVAQRIHGVDEDLEILILCEDERFSQMKQVLSISPFLGNQVRCLVQLPRDVVGPNLSVAAARTRGRRRHHAWLAAARHSLSAGEAPLRSVQVLDHLLNQAPIGVMLVTFDGTITACNVALERLVGASEGHVLGNGLKDIFPGLEQRRIDALMEDATAAGDRPVNWDTFLARGSDGRERSFRISGSDVTARGNQRVVLVLVEDVTDARQREEALRRSQAELRSVAGKLLTAHEDERLRIARELHDDLSQRLAMLTMEVSMLQRDLGLPDQTREALESIRQGMAQLATDIHGMSRQLHPSILTNLGLAEAIKNECVRLSELEGIVVEFSAHEVPKSLPKDTALCLYRIVQEGLRNVVKHSRAKQARVELVGTPDGVQLSIRDSGVGFDPTRAKRRSGLGLSSMKERARLVQGSVTLRSQPHGGTTIVVRAPLGARG
jgi:PAS domain S-box-containing protein